MAPPSKEQKFGSIPVRIRVRIQGVASTQSFIVFGHSFDAVTNAVRHALVETFGQDDDGEVEEEIEVVQPKARIRRRRA